MHVFETVLFQYRDGPVGGLPIFGRAGEPRAIQVGETGEMVHHLRALEGFFLNLVDDREIDTLLGKRGGSGKDRDRTEAHIKGLC